MSTATIERELTYEEERGKPMPTREHGIIQLKLGAQLLQQGHFDVVGELSLDLGAPDGRMTPDIAMLAKQPRNPFADPPHWTEPPVTVWEIQSASQTPEEMFDKARAYLRHGVQSAWVLFPTLQTAANLRPGLTFPETHRGGTVTDLPTGAAVNLDSVFG